MDISIAPAALVARGEPGTGCSAIGTTALAQGVRADECPRGLAGRELDSRAAVDTE
jgi:hypothetical protein